MSNALMITSWNLSLRVKQHSILLRRLPMSNFPGVVPGILFSWIPFSPSDRFACFSAKSMHTVSTSTSSSELTALSFL